MTCTLGVYSQTTYPGGVRKPVLWEAGIADPQTGTTTLEPVRADISLKFTPQCKSRTYVLNHHSVCYTEDPGGMVLNIPAGELDKISLFVVYQLSDTLKEKNLWELSYGSEAEKILTTHRLADYRQGQYLNLLKGKQKTAEIHTYTDHGRDSLSASKTFRLGGVSGKKLPIDKFRGLIAEVILYDRVLSPREQKQVESYLAIKYGIPLYQGGDPEDYLSSGGKVIWPAEENRKYPIRVAGIAKDINGHLDQRSGSSSLEPGIFSLEFGKDEEIPDQSYILWGDNSENLEIKKIRQGQPPGLSRQWKLTTNVPQQNFTLTLDTKTIIGEIPEGSFYWLATDNSGSGDFPAGHTRYQKIAPAKDQTTLRIQGMNFSQTTDNDQVISFHIAPQMFAQAWIKQPDCGGSQPGELSFKVEGGTPPFHIYVQGENYQEELTLTTQEEIKTITGLKPGTYRYKAEDSQGRTYQESLYVESFDAPVSGLRSAYTLVEGSSLDLDAAIPDTNYHYQWTDQNDIKLSYSSKVRITRGGKYKIKITQSEGCESVREVEVREQSTQNIKKVDLFPNPSLTGEYYLRIELLRKSPVQIFLYDATGRLLERQDLEGSNYYLYRGIAPLSGVYYINIQSESSKLTKKLLVQ
jgi:hypothetical protein